MGTNFEMSICVMFWFTYQNHPSYFNTLMNFVVFCVSKNAIRVTLCLCVQSPKKEQVTRDFNFYSAILKLHQRFSPHLLLFVLFLFSDGMTDCSDSECCSHPACSEHIMCLSSNDPVEVLLRKQPPSVTASFYQRVKFLIEENSVQSYAHMDEYSEK